MKPAIVARVLMELSGATLLVLGFLFWLGRALTLISWHILLGAVLTLFLWFVVGLALRARVSRGLVALVFAWSLMMPALGIMQLRLLPGQYHWLIRVLHLAVGVGAVGLGQTLARRVEALDAETLGVGARDQVRQRLR